MINKFIILCNIMEIKKWLYDNYKYHVGYVKTIFDWINKFCMSDNNLFNEIICKFLVINF